LKLSLYIARRYLFSKKSRNAINIISFISGLGIAVGTAALVVVLSVFNGFDGVIKSLMSSFDPDLKISVYEGKSFLPSDVGKDLILPFEGVEAVSEVFEENALVRYDERQFIATLKGVDESFIDVTGIDTMMSDGEFKLMEKGKPYAVVGRGIAYSLHVGLNFIKPLIFYVPNRNASVNMSNPTAAINRIPVFPSGVFSIEQEYDSKYIILPISVVRELLEYTHEVTALEIKLSDKADKDEIQKKIENLVGNDFIVKNRFQQNEVFYRIMKSEKWATFLILTLILIIASFNITGSLSMLIIDKKNDIQILSNMGAGKILIRNIFVLEGWLISFIGSLAGVILGTVISLTQQYFEPVKIGGSGTFVIDAYPVLYRIDDILLVWLTVLFIGFFASYIPSRNISVNILEKKKKL
jgi:lipoprotein-releasing system permease protein